MGSDNNKNNTKNNNKNKNARQVAGVFSCAIKEL